MTGTAWKQSAFLAAKVCVNDAFNAGTVRVLQYHHHHHLHHHHQMKQYWCLHLKRAGKGGHKICVGMSNDFVCIALIEKLRRSVSAAYLLQFIINTCGPLSYSAMHDNPSCSLPVCNYMHGLPIYVYIFLHIILVHVYKINELDGCFSKMSKRKGHVVLNF